MNENLLDVIEVRDPGLDIQEIADQICERIQAHRKQAVADQEDYDAFVASLYKTAKETDFPGQAYSLQQARMSYDNVAVSLSLTPPPKVPILGPLWQRVRVAVHNLVIFYVNRLAYRQIEFNKHILLAVNKVAEREEGEHVTADEFNYMRQEITKLHEEVERLKERLAADNQRP